MRCRSATGLSCAFLWETDGLTQRELSEQAGVTEPTAFMALKAMEKRGLIVRRQIAGNKKNV
jgi:DNA-binding MarR family transcriptional regulator